MLRLADRSDTEHLVRMAKDFFAASPYADEDIDEDRVLEILEVFFLSPQTDRLIILWCDPQPVGMLAVVAETNIFNYKRFSGELMWWIDPDHRKSAAASEMRKAYEFWAKKVGCSKATLVDLLGNLGPYYRRNGYERRETTYIKEL